MGKSILIVGGGTFGTSTAFYLSQNPSVYTSITVLDRFPLPSREAAGNDINKVIRADYPDPLYAGLATESIEQWRDKSSLFGGLHHQCGWIYASTGASDWMRDSVDTAHKLGLEIPQAVSAQETRRRWPQFSGEMKGWQTLWNSSAGWANARGGLLRMANAAKANGVRYIDGPEGYVKQLLFDDQGRCIGVRTADGGARFADVVVVAAGAAAATLLDMKSQLVAKGHVVGHIQLTPDEVKKWADIPIVTHLSGGILFPPQEDGIMKIGAMHFMTNYAGTNTSLPRYRSDRTGDGVPKPVERIIRDWIHQFAPDLAEREWFEDRICWDADTPDFHFLIDEHPSHPGLHLAVGGSGHGFKFLPVIGRYIVAQLEGTLDRDTAHKWRWRPGAGFKGANPFPTDLIELSEIPGWGEKTGTLGRTAKL